MDGVQQESKRQSGAVCLISSSRQARGAAAVNAAFCFVPARCRARWLCEVPIPGVEEDQRRGIHVSSFKPLGRLFRACSGGRDGPVALAYFMVLCSTRCKTCRIGLACVFPLLRDTVFFGVVGACANAGLPSCVVAVGCKPVFAAGTNSSRRARVHAGRVYQAVLRSFFHGGFALLK